ncbi:GDSL-type esterase/lipase family protein [Kitasatospora sp. NPDC048239]|uniref:GDSL-type esterase/lipase family protein n=1 Tax=Kitasatospora sp. NPDC048239 TaxID=3364046 RepID=UPI00371F3E47
MADSERVVHPSDARLTYRGAVSLQETDGGIAPWRIPYPERRLFFPEGGMGRAAMPSGVRLAFRSDTRLLRCAYTARPAPEMVGPPEVGRVDVLVDGEPVHSVELETGTGGGSFELTGLPARDKLIELWLPCLNQFVLRGITVDGGAEVAQAGPAGPRWVHYGSSESQGRGAPSPSRNWPALVARAEGLDLTSLAMGAGCHLQPAYGTLVRDLPADLITFWLGMNAYGARSLNELSYRANLIGLVRSARERHPETPLVVISHYFSPVHDPLHGLGFYSLRQTREANGEVVDLLREHGDRNLYHLDGLRLLGPDRVDLLMPEEAEDRLHLTAEGHAYMAEAFRRELHALVPGPAPAGLPAGN